MSDLIIQLVGSKTNDIYCNILSLCVTLTAIIFQILLCPPHPPQLYLNSQLSQGKPRGLEQVSICTQPSAPYLTPCVCVKLNRRIMALSVASQLPQSVPASTAHHPPHRIPSYYSQIHTPQAHFPSLSPSQS